MIQIDNVNYFTSSEVCAMFNISLTRLITYRKGRNVYRLGKIEWSEEPFLSEKTDYITHIINNRVHILYTEQAIINIQNRRLQLKTKKVYND